MGGRTTILTTIKVPAWVVDSQPSFTYGGHPIILIFFFFLNFINNKSTITPLKLVLSKYSCNETKEECLFIEYINNNNNNNN
jgi:hypothetical protein